LVIVFGAFANAVAMTAPFTAWRDQTQQTLPQPLFIGMLLVFALVVVPILCVTVCGRLSRLLSGQNSSTVQLITSFSIALVPLGTAMWAAHLTFHLLTGFLTVIPVLHRVLAAAIFTAAQPDWSLSARPILSSSITPIQLILLDAGLLFTLYVYWKLTTARTDGGAIGWRMFLPWGTLALALYGAGTWILLQPMQMRGMMMMH
jgi:hypothetical protein